jgi:hypothetical protein
MLVMYLLWLVVVGGGLFLGGGAVWQMTQSGVSLSLLLNALFYLGSAAYGLPRALRLLTGAGSGGH